MPEPVVPRPDLTRLAALLCEREYGQQAREGVLAYARHCGTLEGCDWLEECDRADADALLEDAWPAVQQTSHAWDEEPWKEAHRQPTWTLGRTARIEALYEAHGTTIYPGVELTPPELDVEPFEPSEEDWLYHTAWTAARDGSFPVIDLEPFAN